MSQQHDILASLQEVDLDAGTVFSGTPSGTPVKGYAQPLRSRPNGTLTMCSMSTAATWWSGLSLPHRRCMYAARQARAKAA